MDGVYFRGERLDTDALKWDEADLESFILAVARFATLRGETDIWLVFDCPADASEAAAAEADTLSIWIGFEPDAAYARGRMVNHMAFTGESN